MNMRKKNIIKTSYCKGCLWLVDGRLCPFLRCVKGFGWVSDKNAREGQKIAISGVCKDEQARNS